VRLETRWVDAASLQRNNFDFLRFALASLVVFSHSFALLSGTDATEPLMRLTGGQLCSGELAVDWFFVISGFLITHSWLRGRGTWDFFCKRACRIYPAFVVAMVVCAFIVAPLATDNPTDALNRTQFLELVKGSLTLRGYGYDQAFPRNPLGAINGSMWSISYEAWCYVGVVALGLLCLLRRRRFMLVMFVVAIAVSVIFLVYRLRPGGKILGVIFGSPRIWARLLPYYMAGIVFYLFKDRIPHSTRLATLAAITLVTSALIPYGLAVALPTVGTYVLFWLAYHPRIRLEHWAVCGDFSYGIYLYAFPIQQLLIHWMPALQPLELFALAMPLSAASGLMSWHTVEKWFVYRKRSDSTRTIVVPVASAA
jgi:peptidoglycan/LPS O-acetylase OafA/YrhL